MERTELWGRFLFYCCVILLVVLMPCEIKTGAAALWLLRLLVVRWRMWRVRRRLGERGIGRILMLYDMVEPFERFRTALRNRISPPKGVWR